jgi:hypothetical protein
MNPLKATDWEKRAFRAGLFGAGFALIVGLIVDGLNWLIVGTKPGEGLFWFIAVMFCGMYFEKAIDSLHERLSEIEDAVRRNDG